MEKSQRESSMVKQIQSHLGFINQVDSLEITKDQGESGGSQFGVMIQKPNSVRWTKKSGRKEDSDETLSSQTIQQKPKPEKVDQQPTSKPKSKEDLWDIFNYAPMQNEKRLRELRNGS